MLRWLQRGLVAVLFLVWLMPAPVSAYSYGDANTEDVAETFKLIEASVGGATADWKAAKAAHQARRSEIASHFGESVAVTLDKNFEAQDAKLLTANYKAVLVMNLDRRFTYAKKDLDDYAGAKLLLAKAKATFEVIAPYLPSGEDQIDQAFEDALEALGNPGLFGVGKKEADPETFKKKVDFIYAKVKPVFPYKAYVKPAAPDNQPSAKPSPKPESSASPDAKPDKKPAMTDDAKASASPSASPSPSPSESASASPSPSSEPQASASASASPTASASPAASETPESEEAAAAAGDESTATHESAEHAPMERADKTNNSVTFFVIGGVALVGAGVLWFIRKKGLI